MLVSHGKLLMKQYQTLQMLKRSIHFYFIFALHKGLETGWEAVPMMYLLLKRNSGEELLNRFQSDLKQPTIESSLNSTAVSNLIIVHISIAIQMGCSQSHALSFFLVEVAYHWGSQLMLTPPVMCVVHCHMV